jgi:hypothetical protein
VVAYLRKGETYADLARGFKIGTSTVYRYVREVARRKAFVIGDGTLLRIDRIAMASGRDRAFYSGETQGPRPECAGHRRPDRPAGVDLAALPGARRDIGAAREHGIIDAITGVDIPAVADAAYQGAGPTVAVPQRRRRLDPDTGRYRRLSRAGQPLLPAGLRGLQPAPESEGRWR